MLEGSRGCQAREFVRHTAGRRSLPAYATGDVTVRACAANRCNCPSPVIRTFGFRSHTPAARRPTPAAPRCRHALHTVAATGTPDLASRRVLVPAPQDDHSIHGSRTHGRDQPAQLAVTAAAPAVKKPDRAGPGPGALLSRIATVDRRTAIGRKVALQNERRRATTTRVMRIGHTFTIALVIESVSRRSGSNSRLRRVARNHLRFAPIHRKRWVDPT